jgi:hypothetical protein
MFFKFDGHELAATLVGNYKVKKGLMQLEKLVCKALVTYWFPDFSLQNVYVYSAGYISPFLLSIRSIPASLVSTIFSSYYTYMATSFFSHSINKGNLGHLHLFSTIKEVMIIILTHKILIRAFVYEFRVGSNKTIIGSEGMLHFEALSTLSKLLFRRSICFSSHK